MWLPEQHPEDLAMARWPCPEVWLALPLSPRHCHRGAAPSRLWHRVVLAEGHKRTQAVSKARSNDSY